MLPAARKEPVPVNARRLVLGARARRLGFRQLSTAIQAEVPEGAQVATTASRHLPDGDEGVVPSRLQALKALHLN